MTDSLKHVTVRLRVPPELRDKIADSAKEYNRSMNADMVARLEESFENNLPASLTMEYMRAAEENHDLLRKQIKASNFIMMKLAEKLSDEDPLKKSVLQMLNGE